MSELDSAIERFRGLVSETPSFWRSIDVRVLAREFDGKRINLLSTACLDRRDPEEISCVENLPRSSPVACYHKVLPIAELGNLLSDLRAGTIDFDGIPVGFAKKPSAPESSPGAYDWAYTHRAVRLNRPPETSQFSKGHFLSATGDTSQYLFWQLEDGLDGINNALRRLRIPWDGVDAIARSFLRTNSRFGYHSAASFEFFAPLEMRIESAGCSLWKGKLSYSVIGAAETSDLRLGYFGSLDDGTVVNGDIPLGASLPSKNERVMRWEGQSAIEGVRRLSLFLSVANSNVDGTELVDLSAGTANPRVAAYAVTDPGLDFLYSQFADSPPPKLFEKAIARLFGFGGFVVDVYTGEDRLSNGPDVIAFSPNNASAFVIECTTGPIGQGKGKLGKLVARTARIREALGESAPGVLLPILATALAKTEISHAERQDAATDGIAVLAREDLRELLDLSLGRIAPDAIVEFCKSRVPVHDNEKNGGILAYVR